MTETTNKDVQQAYSNAMLMLATVNDLAEDAVIRSTTALQQRTTSRRTRAACENARETAAASMKRMWRYLDVKDVKQVFMDFMDKRQDQIEVARATLYLSIKEVAEEYEEEDAALLAETCLTALILRLALKTYQRLLIELRRNFHADFSRTWKGLSMYDPSRFFRLALRDASLDVDIKAVEALNSSEQVLDAYDVFVKELFNTTAMTEAERFAVGLQEDSDD